MKRLAVLLAMFVFLNACQENEPVQDDFTGNESTYALLSGSTYPVNGTITFKEMKDGNTKITVTLTGTEGDIKHPVHLHLGNIATPDADVAALLNPVTGSTGISETTLKQLADESPITYQQLVQLNACIKIHLSESGPDKNIILAGGNIGTAISDDSSVGRIGMRVCKSE
jgi:hypothetical protein